MIENQLIYNYKTETVVAEVDKEYKSLLDALKSFELIDNNIQAKGQGVAGIGEFMPCTCDEEESCGEGCINRVLFVECIEEGCPVGKEKCKNRRFQHREYCKVGVFLTSNGKGYGVEANEDIPKDSFILEYTGEVVDVNAFIKRTKQYEKEGYSHFYCMSLNVDEMIDATKKGSIARFLNHSCNPNCCIQKWVVGNYLRMGIFSTREIKKGEELTFDYKFERYNAPAQTCLCGEPNCKGFIGKTKKLSDDGNLDEDDDIDDDDLSSNSSSQDKASKKPPKSTLIENPSQITPIVKSLLLHSKPSKILLIINKLLSIESIPCLRRFIQLHGLFLLKNILKEKNISLSRQVLLLMQKMPINTRNTVEECGIVPVIEDLISTKSDDFIVSTIGNKLLEDWKLLKSVYKIPKAPKPTIVPSKQETTSEQDDIQPQQQSKQPLKQHSSKHHKQSKQSRRSSTPATNNSSSSSINYNSNNNHLRHRGSFNHKKKLLNQLPSDWDYAFSPDGEMYFFNLKTNKTQWEFPFNNNTDPDQPSQQKSSDQLPLVSAEQPQPKLIELYSDSDILQVLEKARKQKQEEEEKERLRQKEEEERQIKKQKKLEKMKKLHSNESLVVNNNSNGSSSTSSSVIPTNQNGSNSDGLKVLRVDEKSAFREEISGLVVKYFSQYKDRISSEEFKKQARKITHLVMEKESRNQETVILNDTKKKVKKFVSSYAEKLLGKL